MLSLQFRVAGLSWPFELLGRSVRNTVGFWVVQCERTGESEGGSVAQGTDARSKRRDQLLRSGGERVVMRRHARHPDGSLGVSKGGRIGNGNAAD